MQPLTSTMCHHVSVACWQLCVSACPLRSKRNCMQAEHLLTLCLQECSVPQHALPPCSAGSGKTDSTAKCAQAYLLLPSLPEHSVGLDADALHCINQHHSPIAQPCSRRHLAAEVYMARGIDQVDQVPCSRRGTGCVELERQAGCGHMAVREFWGVDEIYQVCLAGVDRLCPVRASREHGRLATEAGWPATGMWPSWLRLTCPLQLSHRLCSFACPLASGQPPAREAARWSCSSW